MKKTRSNRSIRTAMVEVQQLETKQLLTGTVAIALSGSDVIISGDDQANDIAVTIDAAGLTVVGLNGTLVKVGNAAPVAAPPALALPAAVNDVKVNLKGGDDELSLEVGVPLTLRTVDVKTGSGNDSLTILVNGNLTLNGDLKVDTGSGNDFVGIDSAAGAIDVLGNVNIATGAGADNVGIVDSVKQGAAQTGAAIAAIANDSAVAGSQSINVGRDLKISTGGADDSVAILGVEVARDLVVNSGFGHADNLGMSNVRVGRNLDLIYGDANALTDVTVAGKLKARSGTGDDKFVLSQVRAGEVDIDLGSGKDQLILNIVNSPRLRVKGGSGKDELFIFRAPGARWSSFEGNAVDAGLIDNVVLELVASGLL